MAISWGLCTFVCCNIGLWSEVFEPLAYKPGSHDLPGPWGLNIQTFCWTTIMGVRQQCQQKAETTRSDFGSRNKSDQIARLTRMGTYLISRSANIDKVMIIFGSLGLYCSTMAISFSVCACGCIPPRWCLILPDPARSRQFCRQPIPYLSHPLIRRECV